MPCIQLLLDFNLAGLHSLSQVHLCQRVVLLHKLQELLMIVIVWLYYTPWEVMQSSLSVD